MEWCQCEWPEEIFRNGKYFCEICEGAIECELCDTGESMKQATIKHIDYLVCAEHESSAIDNVADRRW